MPGAIALNTRIPLLHLSLGKCYEAKRLWQKALESYLQERQTDPGNTQLALVIGRVLLRLERYEAALAELISAEQASDSAGYYMLLGTAHRELGNAEEADRFIAMATQIAGSRSAANRAALRITGQRREAQAN